VESAGSDDWERALPIHGKCSNQNYAQSAFLPEPQGLFMAGSVTEKFVLPGSTEQMQQTLSTIRKYVADIAGRAGLGKQAIYDLQLSVDEIATNIITYGYKGGQGDIIVHSILDDDSVTITLEDSAPAFDPTQAPRPDPNQPIEDRILGGWGIEWARTHVDKFWYERIGGHNHTHFTVNRGKTE
jgi:anti-sigma regulatory factor (Ser/Thr protein kinase)